MNKQINIDKNSPIKVSHFSWIEYVGTFFVFSILAAMPGILYGYGKNDITLILSYTPWYVIYWGIITGIFCVFTAYQKYKAFDKPMRRLSEAANKVANGDFSVYLQPEHMPDKLNYIDVMYENFNKMVAELGTIETLKNDFTSNVSHEMKTPLAVIRNYTTALKKDNLPLETRNEYMNTIIEATDRLSSLITNILKLNKLENQEINPMQEPYDLCRQLSDCALNFEYLIEQKNIEFEVDIEDRAIITADASMLEIVWNNLISNAIKFTPKSGKVILKQNSHEDSITVSVSDTGCGINNETKKHIFDKFYQGDTSHSTEGNGLGLALVYRVVDRMGGTISVKSVEGKGSTFTVTLNL